MTKTDWLIEIIIGGLIFLCRCWSTLLLYLLTSKKGQKKGKNNQFKSSRHRQRTDQIFCLISIIYLSVVCFPSSITFTPFVLHRWDFLFAPFASSGVYSLKGEQLTHSGEAWVVQRCVWCSFIAMVTVGASEWEWSKARASAWWIWRRLTPPCPPQSESFWSWETKVWSLHRGIKHRNTFCHIITRCLCLVCFHSTLDP